jgi:hypothetical protein
MQVKLKLAKKTTLSSNDLNILTSKLQVSTTKKGEIQNEEKQIGLDPS